MTKPKTTKAHEKTEKTGEDQGELASVANKHALAEELSEDSPVTLQVANPLLAA